MDREIVINLIPWDAAEVFPDGTHAATKENFSEAGQKFMKELVGIIGRGATVLGVLPLVEPGRALIVVKYENSPE
jgi:hypothetical protein